MKRAYRMTAYGITGVMAARSRGQAKFRLLRELQDLGYKPHVSDIMARRAPEHDGWAELDSTGTCFDENLLPKDR